MASRQTSARIDDAAADWAARADKAPLDPQLAAELEAWLAADPRRAGAYARARAVLSHFDKAAALGADFRAEDFEPAAPRGPNRRAVVSGGLALAAGVAGVAVTYGLHLKGLSTRRGEMRRVPLPDGSVVTLNTDSRVVVDFSRDQRNVRLAGGEALFDVAKDPSRPFVVHASDVRVRAVGTSFSVRRREGEVVEVVVREGVVDVSGKGPGAAPIVPHRLTADTVAYASPHRPMSARPIPADEVDRRLAWREGMIAFHGETLADAAAEFARYSDIRIMIDDPAVARRTVVGLFVANDPAGFAKAVATSFGLHAEAGDDGVHLSAGETA